MLHVGLTGNIASGKSQAAVMFAELGAHIIDADTVGHSLLTSGNEIGKKIIGAFGTEILGPDGEIDRRKLGNAVFINEGKRRLLNSLIHPAIHSEILRSILELEQSSSGGIIVVDAALMVETGHYRMYDRLIVVTCDPALQIARLMNRDGLNEQEARARIMSQMPIEEKLRVAHYTIDSSGTLKQTREQVEAIYRDLLIHEMRVKERGR